MPLLAPVTRATVPSSRSAISYRSIVIVSRWDVSKVVVAGSAIGYMLLIGLAVAPKHSLPRRQA